MNENTEYEKLAQFIYQSLLKAEGYTNIKVEHNITLQGKSGCDHQIDVYWEFTIGGITQKVAIECKNYASDITVGRVRDFFGVLHDVGNINGILVTKKGFQSGAKKYADYYGISLKEMRFPNKEDWKGRIKTIQLNIHFLPRNVKDRIIVPDFDWLISKGIIDDINSPLDVQIRGLNSDIWIIDSNDNRLTNFYELEEKLPHEMKPEKDKIHFYEYQDAFIETDNIGKIKIKKIGFKYDIDDILSETIIEAEEITKAILKDIKSGEIKFISKDGTVK